MALSSAFLSRAIACVGCSKAALNCEKARCLRCDLEFPLYGPIVPTELGQRNVSVYMNKIIENYYNQVGRNSKR